MMYKFMYVTMLISFGYLSSTAPDVKSKVIGLLCFILNGVLFWR